MLRRRGVSNERGHRIEPIGGLVLVVGFEVDPVEQSPSTEFSESFVDLPSVSAEVCVARVSECEHGVTNSVQIGCGVGGHALPERGSVVGRFAVEGETK